MKMRRKLLIFIFLAAHLLIASSCAAGKVRQYKVKVVKEYPHDEMSYTQGLFFQGDKMIETTGQYGESTLRLVDLASGKAVKKLDFDRKYFIEGSVELDGKIFILTWQNKVSFVYDANTLEYVQTYRYPREGWGLTTDGKSLIASDGSSRLYWLDKDFRQQKALTVKLNGRAINQLNELEWIDGKIWANVYGTDQIVRINPQTGTVTGVINCRGLLPVSLRKPSTDVLNGIAVDARGGIWLTGKYWPKMYRITLVEKK